MRKRNYLTRNTAALFLAISSSLVISGCTNTQNMKIGDATDHISLAAQRDAMRTVKKVDKAPEGAIFIGKITVARCHRDAFNKAPDEWMIINDLKIKAYSQGADYISDVELSYHDGFWQNCWYILNGDAKIYKKPEI